MEVAREQGFQRQLGAGARRGLKDTVLVTHAAANAANVKPLMHVARGPALHHSGRGAGDGSGRLVARDSRP